MDHTHSRVQGQADLTPKSPASLVIMLMLCCSATLEAQGAQTGIADVLRGLAPTTELDISRKPLPTLSVDPLFSDESPPVAVAAVRELSLATASFATRSFELGRVREETRERSQRLEQARADLLAAQQAVARASPFDAQTLEFAEQHAAETAARVVPLEQELAGSRQRQAAAESSVAQVSATLNSAAESVSALQDRLTKGLVHEQDHLLVKFSDNATADQIRAVLNRYQLSIAHALPELGIINVVVPRSAAISRSPEQIPKPAALPAQGPSRRVTLPAPIEDAVQLHITMGRLRLEPIVTAVCPNLSMTAKVTPSVPHLQVAKKPTGKKSSAQTLMNQDGAWALSDKLKQGVTIGIVDLGFEQHSALVTRPSSATLCSSVAQGESRRHGTAVAGIISAMPDGSHAGGWGWPVAKLPKHGSRSALDIVTCAAYGAEYTTGAGVSVSLALLAAFDRILASIRDLALAEPDLRVLNVSLGYNWVGSGVKPSSPNGHIVTEAAGIMWSGLPALFKSALFVCAAGNDNGLPAEQGSPCAYAQGLQRARVVVVQAVDDTGRRSTDSNVNGDVSAPGEGIITTGLGNAYASFSGTSAAAPQIAGLAGLILASNPNLSPEAVKEIILKNAKRQPSGEIIPDAAACLREAAARAAAHSQKAAPRS
jgi:subtilisin family serine protease